MPLERSRKKIFTNTFGGRPYWLGGFQDILSCPNAGNIPTISRTVTLLLGAQKSLAGAPYHFAYTIVHFWSFEEDGDGDGDGDDDDDDDHHHHHHHHDGHDHDHTQIW